MRDKRYEIGSALILAVVLTSMLAIIGVTFLMVARVNRIATSAISENKELNFAVETVIAKISQELVLDVPGAVDPNEEYYDYPDSANRWLASLEPYYVGPADYRWWHISDIYDRFGPQGLGVPVGIINDYQSSTDVGDSNASALYPADADGDGVADSRWIKLPNMSSSKGKPIYAAIRVVDNGGMLNVNTAHKFDPNDPTITADDIDGSSQMQINLMALSWHPGDPCDWYNPNDETVLLNERANYGFGGVVDPFDLDRYERDVIWRYDQPDGPYTPFDISDELELRNRFLLNHTDIDTRLEPWGGEFRDGTLSTPVTSGGQELDTWFKRAYDAGFLDPNYAYRHIATTYNMDRIINPVGLSLNNGKMVNVNTDGEALLYYAIRAGLYDANVPDPNSLAAQMAVNIVDFRDNDSSITVYFNPDDGKTYYGFERPCIYISELVYKEDVNDPNCRSYAIELYKPYFEDNDPCGWQLVIDGNPIPINWKLGTRRFHVIRWEDPNAPLDVPFDDPYEPNDTDAIEIFGYDPSIYSRSPYDANYSLHFNGGSTISLQRFVADVNNYIVVDSVQVLAWLPAGAGIRSHQRDITIHKCIRRLWPDANEASFPTLGQLNNYSSGDTRMIQAHPANKDFINIGEIGIVFCRPAYNVPSGVTEPEIRLDLTDLRFQQIFNYLTVFDPTVDGIDNNGDGYGIVSVDPNELKIPGRININTAPWYVIAQLPWIQYKDSVAHEKAQAISDYRDKLGAYIGRAGEAGFTSIGEMMQVAEIQSLGNDGDDNLYSFLPDRGPDLTDDLARDDFEERDVIFARISNLVTVRSDVFTAYILVRIGTDGPQKRVIAILDRSNVNSTYKKVKVRALHPVPDPR